MSFEYINQALQSHLDSLLRHFSRETALYIVVKRQRKEYDPNDPLTEEQREMKAGDTVVIITAVVSTSGVILVLILLWYVYRRYQRHAAKKRERAAHRARNVPPPPSLDIGSQPHLPNSDDITLNDLHVRDIWVPESGGRTSRDSRSTGSTTVVLDVTGTNDIIITPVGPTPRVREVNSAIGFTDPQLGRDVNSAIGSTVAAPDAEVVDSTPQASPDVRFSVPTELNTHDVEDDETVLGVGHQVPPYANDVRAERRRREREQVRDRHRGMHTAQIQLDDRQWVQYEFPNLAKSRTP
ncbi:hypothetical protein L211DRAFT_850366 [Terfezia boudieri ATCC MYA-4762]|uniref:Uncharacterized protein n=1 Tax=Terfezia boudieri ATCC MYA-4762 TaxID=1051890 RepID=A0A3N4LN69_9PEZI|nr:hypothetical protein L211DRAFT_850366 [Terfezia boudieri ATCC MYA-4762]